jgi:hypothetical protein
MPEPFTPISIPYTPNLGWSHSRYETFSSCKRKYFYQYYPKFDREFEPKKIQELKQLSSAPLVVGDIVHKAIEAILNRLQKSEDAIDRERLDGWISDAIAKEVRSKNFMEVYYGQVSEVDVDEMKEKATLCVNNFVDSDRFKWVMSEGVKFKKAWIIEPPGFGETVIEGSKAYAKFDFMHRGEDEILIFDWKTGKEDNEKYLNQLRAYSFWASYHLQVDPHKITPVIAYLYPEYSEVECSFDEAAYHEFATTVRAQIDEMKGYCSDPQENIPKDKEQFPKRTFSNFCNYCNYKELCWGQGTTENVDW